MSIGNNIHAERRRNPRFSFIYPIVYSVDGQKEQSTCLSENISTGGMMLHLSKSISPDSVLNLCLPFSSGPHHLKAKVRWVSDENQKYFAGVEFINGSKNNDTDFQNFVLQCSRFSR